MAKKKPFRIVSQIDSIDKIILIYGPDDLDIEVYFDDVDHRSVKTNTLKMVKLLNEHWDD
jgi:hypothetical protein